MRRNILPSTLTDMPRQINNMQNMQKARSLHFTMYSKNARMTTTKHTTVQLNTKLQTTTNKKNKKYKSRRNRKRATRRKRRRGSSPVYKRTSRGLAKYKHHTSNTVLTTKKQLHQQRIKRRVLG